MRALVVALLATGCLATQSARVLEPGKTQVTGTLVRYQDSENDDDLGGYFGEVAVRTGLGPRFDGGAQVRRMPSQQSTLSIVTLEPKVELTEPGAASAISFALGLGLAWGERRFDAEDGTYVVAPRLLYAQRISHEMDIVVSPHVLVIKPHESRSDVMYSAGMGIGMRFFDASRTWAVQPELSISRFSGADSEIDSLVFFAGGLSISVGN